VSYKKITKIIESSEIFNLHNVGVVGLPSSLYDIHQRTDGNLCFTLVAPVVKKVAKQEYRDFNNRMARYDISGCSHSNVT